MRPIAIVSILALILFFSLQTTAKNQPAPIKVLPEYVVEDHKDKLVHILAYVREYSSLTSYTDTVFLFREKLVDFMLPTRKKNKYKGWRKPRVIKSKSYYRFTNSHGLDSVSDESHFHFSWSDWMEIPQATRMPSIISDNTNAGDTVRGKYSPTEIWRKGNDTVSLYVNVLADSKSRKWIPNLTGFFNNNLEFDRFELDFLYDNVLGSWILPSDLKRYSFQIESTGRGHGMFRFTNHDQPLFVSTEGEVYILDKEYISQNESRAWEKHDFNNDDFEIFTSPDAPPLPQSIVSLIGRVDTLDKEKVRLCLTPDTNLGCMKIKNSNFNFGNRLLFLLKDITGITLIKSRRNLNKKWTDRKKEIIRKNKTLYQEE